jgi:hypothetical protein
MRSRRFLVALALVPAALAVAGTPAGAKTKTVQIQTEVRFLQVDRNTFREFTAKIAARKPCRDDRQGSLWYKPTEDAAPQRIDTDRSNRKGAFLFELDDVAIAGLYAIRVSRATEREDDAKFICGPVKGIFYSF